MSLGFILVWLFNLFFVRLVIILFDEKTSRHYFDRYRKGGLQALPDNNYSGAEPKLDTHQMSERAFLKEYEHLKASKGQNDPIYFADAAHPQHNSIPSYGRIKKGQEKALKANCGRRRLNINGAINIETLEPMTGFYDTINADSTIDLFLKIEAKHPEAKAIYIIVDKA